MDSRIMEMDAQKLPPVGGKIIVLSVDGTSRNYDLWAIAFGTPAIPATATAIEKFLSTNFDIEMVAVGANPPFFAFSDGGAAPTIDDTAATGPATGNAAYVTNGADCLPLNWRQPFTINRGRNRFISVKCAGAGTCTLRIHIKSDRSDTGARS